MILTELILTNFGAYRGEHRIRLAPTSKKKPIVLFGGMNGAGKTTLMDALQLVLYGKLARCSSRGQKAYDDYLLGCVNRSANPNEGAAIELEFKHSVEGRVQSFRVSRNWVPKGSSVSEHVQVFVDQRYDSVVSDAWAEYVEEFIPSRLAHLFFFDGEKIENLADLENASEMLRTGVHSLLGLDMVDRLHVDLGIVATRSAKQARLGTAQAALLESERAEVESARQRRDAIQLELEGVQAELRTLAALHGEVEAQLQAQGGELFAQKTQIEQDKRDVKKQVDLLDDQLREFAGGPGPLALVAASLETIAEQARVERAAIRAERMVDTLQARDQEISGVLRSSGASRQLLLTIQRFMEDDRRRRAELAGTARFLNMTESAEDLLREVRTFSDGDAREKCHSLLQERQRVLSLLTVIERKWSTVPDEAAIAPLLLQRREKEQEIESLSGQIRQMEQELARANSELERRTAAAEKQRQLSLELGWQSDDSRRMHEYARKAQATLVTFRADVVARHIARIQREVLASLQLLLRKESLVAGLQIRPEDFSLVLRGADTRLVSPERLSAGERQLLAVSLLWGLARASKRTLPAVIDTPLGRLDSSHRGHLVGRYFPAASEQVLLLSTDEEIRGEYLDALRPFVSHYYLLEYDEQIQSTSVVRGYFTREGTCAA